MAACRKIITLVVLVIFMQVCTAALVEKPTKINLDILQAIYEKKSQQTKIEQGVFGLPENVVRGHDISAKDELDCNVRYLAYNYSKKILSPSADLSAVANGLQLSSLCGITPKLERQPPYLEHEKKILSIKANKKFIELFVDASKGKIKRRSTFTNIEEALNACVIKRPTVDTHCIIRLRDGMHFIRKPLQLTSKHSNILITR